MLDAAAVTKAGAANLQELSPTPAVLYTLRKLYAAAVHDVFVYALVSACIALVFTFGMEHKNLRKSAEHKKLKTASSSSVDVFV